MTVLHISRPLEGGIEIPDDPSEIDVATFRKYTAILRSFPENELVFHQLNETINQVHKICAHEKVYARYKETLPASLRQEWEAASMIWSMPGLLIMSKRMIDYRIDMEEEGVIYCSFNKLSSAI